MTGLPRLIVFTDPGLALAELTEGIRSLAALGAGRVGVIHKHPQATTRRYVEEARVLQAACGVSSPFFVHGRFDVAIALGAHLHLPVEGPRPSEVRPWLSAGTWVSTSAHSREELTRVAGADFVFLSPVSRPTSKPDDSRPVLGVDGYRALAALSPVPAYALGGVTPESIRMLGRIPGAAVLGGMWRGEETPLEKGRRLLDAL